MKKHLLLSTVVMALTIMLNSCKSADMQIPIAINTVNSVGLKELNLKHGTDYTIMNSVTAEATVIYTSRQRGKIITIKEENGEFEAKWKYDFKSGRMIRKDFDGIARFGFLNNDYSHGSIVTDEIAPEYFVRNLAIYRLINQAKVRGADGVIEPVLSTNAENRGKHDIVFKTTVSAKLMKLNTDAK